MSGRHLWIAVLFLLVAAPLYGQYALEFDGVDDYAEVPHDPVFEFTNQMTVEVMFYVDQIPSGDARIINKKLYDVYDTFAIYFRSGELRGASYTLDLISGNLIIPGGSVPLGAWNHIAMTYDGARRRFFLNGALMDSSDVVETIANEATPVSFGRYDAGFGQYFGGGIDEARVWNVARTGDEIRAAMNTELTGDEPGLVGYWKFNEGVGDTIYDATPNGNHGQLGSTSGPDASDPAWIAHEFPPLPVSLFISPTGPTVIPRGNTLQFSTLIANNRDNTVEGDYWLSVLLPDSNEVLVPDELLNFPNPLSGQILPFDFVELSNWLFVPMRADTGSYDLIGKIGQYPDVVIDEESFGFRVIE